MMRRAFTHRARRRWWAPRGRDAYLPGFGDPTALAEAMDRLGYRKDRA